MKVQKMNLANLTALSLVFLIVLGGYVASAQSPSEPVLVSDKVQLDRTATTSEKSRRGLARVGMQHESIWLMITPSSTAVVTSGTSAIKELAIVSMTSASSSFHA